MRRFLALAHASAMESLSEPLSCVLFFVAALTVHLAPVFHYHQFGEPTRLPQECGLSALFVFGIVFASSAAFRTIGRELSSGTASVALVRPLSRSLFFSAKLAGVFFSLALFFVSIVFATMLSSKTASIGAELAMHDGVTRLWPIGIRYGICFTILAIATAAFLNRFFRMRFCFWTCILVSVIQPLAYYLSMLEAHKLVHIHSHGVEGVSLLPPFASMLSCCLAFISMTGALSVRLKTSVVAGCVSFAVVLSFLSVPLNSKVPFLSSILRAILPNTGMFWMPSSSDVFTLTLSGLAISVFWMTVGCILIRGKEIS
jgi:hypothetical protein